MSKLDFTSNSLFKEVLYDYSSDNWTFIFDDKIAVGVSGFWRILDKNKIILVSLDHGHRFGLPEPVDLVKRITSSLKGQKLLKIKVDENTADLKVVLTNELELEVFIASIGYETYDFFINGKHYIGQGSGELAII